MKHITWFQVVSSLEEFGYHLDVTSIPDDVIHAEAGRRNAARRQTFGTAGGRKPIADRCACGKFSAAYARSSRHKCREAANG